MRRALVLGVVLLFAVADAEPLGVGSTLRPFALEDQHGAAGGVDESVRVLLLTRDMGGGGVVKQGLAAADQLFLEAHGAAYVADVSGMPSLALRLFALPSLQKRPYRVLLDRDGAATRDLPHVAGAVTVLRLDRLRVTGVAHPANADDLRAALEAAAAR